MINPEPGITGATPGAGGRKRIFIGLLCATCVAVCLGLFLLLILPWLGNDPGYLRHVSICVGVFGMALLCWLCLSLVYNIHTGKKPPGIAVTRHVMIRLMLPLMEIVGKLVGIDRKIVRRSFIKVNNEFVRANARPARPEEVLVLLPHCIQASKCPHRLSYSLDHCARCGNCQVGELIGLAERMGFHLAIATGGTIARGIVVARRPKCIVAVACERDLSSGIQDCYPIPVYGVLNIRPNGPCRDTFVPLANLHMALAFFLGSEDEFMARNAASTPSRATIRPVALNGFKPCGDARNR